LFLTLDNRIVKYYIGFKIISNLTYALLLVYGVINSN